MSNSRIWMRLLGLPVLALPVAVAIYWTGGGRRAPGTRVVALPTGLMVEMAVDSTEYRLAQWLAQPQPPMPARFPLPDWGRARLNRLVAILHTHGTVRVRLEGPGALEARAYLLAAGVPEKRVEVAPGGQGAALVVLAR